MARWSKTTPCERAAQWISLSLDGEISTLEAAALERHLGRCARCAAQSEEVAAITAAVRSLPPEPMRLPFVPPARRPALPRRRRAALAFATLGAVAAAVGVMTIGPPVTIPHPEALISWEALERARAVAPIEPGTVPHIVVSDSAPIPPSPYWTHARAASI